MILMDLMLRNQVILKGNLIKNKKFVKYEYYPALDSRIDPK